MSKDTTFCNNEVQVQIGQALAQCHVAIYSWDERSVEDEDSVCLECGKKSRREGRTWKGSHWEAWEVKLAMLLSALWRLIAITDPLDQLAACQERLHQRINSWTLNSVTCADSGGPHVFRNFIHLKSSWGPWMRIKDLSAIKKQTNQKDLSTYLQLLFKWIKKRGKDKTFMLGTSRQVEVR